MCQSVKVPTVRFRESRSDGRQVSLVSSSVFPEKNLQIGLKVITRCGQRPGEQTAGRLTDDVIQIGGSTCSLWTQHLVHEALEDG